MGIKIDFARVFPGLVIFLVGLGLFVVFLLLAFLSFFLFFFPPLQGIFYVTLGVLLASLTLMGVGILLMFAGVRGLFGWTPRGRAEGTLSRHRRRDELSPPQRIGEIFGLLVSLLVLLFFLENQMRNTGFFTARFGEVEQILFYGPYLVGFAVSLARAVHGRRNAIRPLQVLQDGFMAISAFWLLSVFPFDFPHLTYLLPEFVQDAFFWVNNDVGGLVLLIIGVVSLAGMAYNSVLYVLVRARHSAGNEWPW